MADWPDTDELAQVLNVDNVGDWQTTLDRVRSAAINVTKLEVGNWDEDVDEPDEALAQAALRAAEVISQRPGATAGQVRSAVHADPVFQSLLFGHRRSFGVA